MGFRSRSEARQAVLLDVIHEYFRPNTQTMRFQHIAAQHSDKETRARHKGIDKSASELRGSIELCRDVHLARIVRVLWAAWLSLKSRQMQVAAPSERLEPPAS